MQLHGMGECVNSFGNSKALTFPKAHWQITQTCVPSCPYTVVVEVFTMQIVWVWFAEFLRFVPLRLLPSLQHNRGERDSKHWQIQRSFIRNWNRNPSILDESTLHILHPVPMQEVVCPVCLEAGSKGAEEQFVDGHAVRLTLMQDTGLCLLWQTCYYIRLLIGHDLPLTLTIPRLALARL